MHLHPRHILAILTVLTVCLPASADAFKQTMTCTDSGFYACDAGQTPKPVRWERPCASYRINGAGTTNISGAPAGMSQALEQAVITSFDTWNQVSCSDLQMPYDGLTPNADATFNRQSGANNMNLVVWRDEGWDSIASREAFALTSVTYNPKTGLIADADIEINSQVYTFSVDNRPKPDEVDLRNTLTHEVGHFLGLDHPEVEAATMYKEAEMADISKRSLHPDDIDGICHIYPAEEDELPGCEQPLPKDDDDDGGGGDGGCCATTHAPAPTGMGWILLALGLALGGAWRLANRAWR